MDKGNQNSAFFQNAAFQNLEYDMQQLYRQLARPVLCPVMAIPQDMLYNIQGFGNAPADLGSREKIVKSSVQKVFISSTSCFQSYKPQQRSVTSSGDKRKDVAVLTSKQNIYDKIQKRDVGTPTSRFDTTRSSKRNVQYLFKKNVVSNSFRDAQCGGEIETFIPNIRERDNRLRRLLKELLAARKLEKQFAQNSNLFKSQLTKAQKDEEFVRDKNGDLNSAKTVFKKDKNFCNDVYDTYYMNCPNYFANRRKCSYNCRLKSLRKSPRRYPCRTRPQCCYPMSSEGRLKMLQKEKEECYKRLQPKKPQESTTCDYCCECHDFNYYNRKIKGILEKYGESVDCSVKCWPLRKCSNTKERILNVSNYNESSIDEQNKSAKKFLKKFDISYPPCSCFPDYSESLTTTTVGTDESKSGSNGSKQLHQNFYPMQKDFKCLSTDNPQDGYEQNICDCENLEDDYEINTCDGVKSNSFPYLCSCFNKKLMHDKAILGRSCCNSILKTNGVQTEVSKQLQDSACACNIEAVVTKDEKRNYYWMPKDDKNFTFKAVPPKFVSGTNINVCEKMKNVYPSATDDTVRAIHNEKLQGIFEKYCDIKTAISNFEQPHHFVGNDTSAPANGSVMIKCDKLCEQIQKQHHEVKQLSCHNEGSNGLLLNIMGKLEELTKHISLYINEANTGKQCCPRVQHQNSQKKSSFWNFNVQQTNRSTNLDEDTMSPIILSQHTGTQFDSTPLKSKDAFQEETNKIKRVKKDVEEIVNDILQKVNAVETIKQRNTPKDTNITNEIKTPKRQVMNTIKNQITTSNNHKKMTIAVNTDPLGLVSLLKMSTEALMRFLSYVPMVSSNPIFGIAYKQSVSHYVCNICGAIFQRSAQLRDHIEEHHNFEVIRDCCICRHTLELLQQPVAGLFTCQYCGRHFTRAYCCELHEQDCAKIHGIKTNISSSLALLR